MIDSSDDEFIKHREALLHNPGLVQMFNELKKSFEGKEMTEYRKAKGDFLTKNIR